MMKVCFVYNSIFTQGGIQRCVTILSNYLVKKGYDVTVICCDNYTHLDRKIYNLNSEVKVIFIKNSFIKRVLRLYRKPLHYLNNKYGIFKNCLCILKKIYYPAYHDIKKIIDKENYDLIISNSSYFNALISLLNIKNKIKIGWQHSSYSSNFIDGDYLNQDKIVQNMFKELDDYVVLINNDKKLIKKNLGYEVSQIYNALETIPVETCKFSNKKFIAVGRLVKVKRFDLLIRNFNEFSKFNNDWSLDIYGEGTEREYLQNLIDEFNLNDRVKLCGFCSNIKEKYLESSVYCMTSIDEGFAMVVLEAISCGLPVICYNIPPMREMLEESCSFIIDEGNCEDFISKMKLLSSDEKMYNAFSKHAKERSKDFDIDIIGKQWRNLFEKVINEKGKN